MSSLFSAQNPATSEVRIIGTVHSQVGRPCSLAPALNLPIELAEAAEYDGWVVPFPLAADILTVFSLFGLWQSSRGLMMEGRRIFSLRRGVGTAITHEPVLVGDYLDGQQVIQSQISYADATKLYTVRVRHGTPPPAIELNPVTYRYYESLLKSDSTIAQEVLGVVEKLFSTVLPMVTTTTGTPLTVAPAQASFEQLVASAKESIEQVLSEQEERQWRL